MIETTSESIVVRDYRLVDKNFIFSTFLRGLYHGDFFYHYIPKNIFMTQYHKVLEYLLAKPNIYVKVACLKSDPDVILGYVIMENGVIHFTFIKKAWRGRGMTRLLMPDSYNSATHMTKVGMAISNKKGIVYNPFLLN